MTDRNTFYAGVLDATCFQRQKRIVSSVDSFLKASLERELATKLRKNVKLIKMVYKEASKTRIHMEARSSFHTREH